MLFFTWGHKLRLLCTWSHNARCKCGASSWLLLVDWAYFTLFWIFGATSGHTYQLMCQECERRASPAMTTRHIDALLGNPVPFRIRFGLAAAGVLFGVSLLLGAGSDSKGGGSNAGEDLWVAGFIVLIIAMLAIGTRSAYRGAPVGEESLAPAPRMRIPFGPPPALPAVHPPTAVAPPPIPQVGATATPPASSGAGQRACPWCAEDIKAAARLCRFCGSDVDPITSAPVAASGEDISHGLREFPV